MTQPKQKARLWVLLVEDDSELAALLTEELEAQNFKVVHSAKVTDALGKLARQKFDSILLDLRLERGDGEQVLNHLRSHSSEINYRTPVIVMSGFLDRAFVQRNLLKTQGFLVKPFSVSQLMNKLSELKIARPEQAEQSVDKAA